MRIAFFITSIFFSTCSIAANVGLSGGLGGHAFEYPDNITMQSIKLCGATLVDSIETTYTTSNWFPQTVKHGGNGGTCSTLDLSGYALKKITGCFNGNTINSLTLIRSDGATLTKGQCKGAPFSYGSTDPYSYSITGFYGRSATLLDAIGVKIARTSYLGGTGPSGSKGGYPFQLSFANAFSMKVCSGTKIDSITITNYDNSVIKVGGSGGRRCETIVLNGAAVYAISGFYAMDGVRQLNIFTGGGTYSFGEATGLLNFSYRNDSGGLKGLIGRSGSIIDAIGAVF